MFVSYHHKIDKPWYELFSEWCETYDVFEDTSPERAKDSDDAYYIMWSLRENHITGSSCTIVLCGAETRTRKFVDWEIHDTLEKQHGLAGIQLPTCKPDTRGYVHVPDWLADNINSGYAVWIGWESLAQGGAPFLQQQIEITNKKSKSLIRNDRQKMGRCAPSLSSIFGGPSSLLG